MAVMKDANKFARKILTKAQKAKIKAAVQTAEDKVMANYKKAANMSGADWAKLSKHVTAKVKKDMTRAETRIENLVRENPGAVTVVAAAIGALVGVIVMSELKKKYISPA